MTSHTDNLSRHAELPLVRLSLAIPFLEELERRGVDSEAAVSGAALSVRTIRTPETFVPASVMYSLLEALAHAAGDPYLAVRVAETMDLAGWPPFAEAIGVASSLGDFFHRFVIATKDHATSVTWEIQTDGATATFRSRRTFHPTRNPAQADAFYAGLFVNIFRHASGIEWNPQVVTVTVCDLAAVPQRYENLNLLQGDRSGPSIRFPSDWLLLPIEHSSTAKSAPGKLAAPPRTLISSVRESLQPYLHLPDLSVARAASICGYSERLLRRKLQEAGTSFTKEVSSLRTEKACRLLRESADGIASIGESVGFSNSSVFARWFKKQTGVTPKDYRKQHRIG